MAELLKMDCPQCAQANHPKSIKDGIQEFRCRSCGMVYYGPCGCDTNGRDARATRPISSHEVPALPEDWRISEPVTVVKYGSATPYHAGGC